MSTTKHKKLRDKVLHAGSWTIAGYITSQTLRLAGNLILTRLLVPEVFGIMTLVTAILMFLNFLSDFGFLANIVHSKHGEEPRFLNTVWVIQIIRGALLTIITLLISWLLLIAGKQNWLSSGTVYADPILPIILATMSLAPLIFGFQSTNLFVSNRKLQLVRVIIIELVSQTTGLTIMIVWAIYDRSIWALVIGSMVTYPVKTYLSHKFIPGPANKFVWDKEAFFEIFHFGKWIFVSSVFNFLQKQGDKLLLGGVISTAALGVYSIAYFLAAATLQAISQLSDRVVLPALGEISRNQQSELSNVYYKIRLRVDFACMFLFGFLFTTGETIVEFLYDDRYNEAGWMLEVLSIFLLSVGFLIADKCFVVLGHVKQRAYLNVINALTLFALFPAVYNFFGFVAAIWLIALSWIPRTIISLWLMKKYNLLQLHKEFRMFPVIFAGMIVGLAVNKIATMLI